MTDHDEFNCHTCNTPTSPNTAIPVAIRCGCCSGPPERLKVHGGFCSEPCRQMSIRAGIAGHRRCATCGGKFPADRHDEHGNVKAGGREAVYCGEDCRKQMEYHRDLAIKELAKGTTNYRNLEDLQAACQRADLLLDYWVGRGPTKPIDPPDARAKTGLRHRIDTLKSLLTEANERAWQERERERETQRQKKLKERIEADREADRKWRKELLEQAKQ